MLMILKLLFDDIINLEEDDEFKKEVLNITIKFDERMTRGSKSIIHLNNYLIVVYKYKIDFNEVKKLKENEQSTTTTPCEQSST